MIATWYLRDDVESSGYFPNISVQSSDPEASAIYLRCVYDFFKSSLAVNEGVDHVLFTNTLDLKVASFDLTSQLKDLGITLVILPLTYRVPSTWLPTFRNQFYLYDIFVFLDENPPQDGWVLVADSDCVWLRSCDRARELIRKEGVGTLSVGYEDPETLIDGLSRESLRQFMSEVGMRNHEVAPGYCGGELVGVRADVCQQIAAISRQLFDSLLRKHRGNPSFVCEEAHMLSMIVADFGLSFGNLNSVGKRVWTSRRYTNTQPTDLELDVWHLPAEKRYGFLDLFCQLVRNPRLLDSQSAADRHQLLSHLMGVPRALPRKIVRDRLRLASFRLRGLNKKFKRSEVQSG